MNDAIVVFGVASDGSTEQWDGHRTPPGILLRWFAPNGVDFPDFGFDVYRALVPDAPPLPFNDLNVPFVEGHASWTYGSTTLSCPTGLHFERAQLPGWWRAVVTSGSPLTVEFTEPAWFITVVSAQDTSDLNVTGYAQGVERMNQQLYFPGASLSWRTRGLDRVTIDGEGSVSFIGIHLLEDKASWQHLVHLCLPVIDPGYSCGPLGAASEPAAASQRLPVDPAAEWGTRFAAQFAELLPVLRRIATRSPSQPLPGSSDPDAPILDADERLLVEVGVLDPHVARIVGLAYDDPLGGHLDGREYVYKVTGAWRGTPVTYLLADGDVVSHAQADGVLTPVWQAQPPGLELTFSTAVMRLEAVWGGATGASWAVTDSAGGVTTGILGPGEPVLARDASVIALRWQGAQPTLESLSFTPRISRFGLLPGIVAVDPGPPAGPSTISAHVSRRSPSVAPSAALTWDTPRAPDGTIAEGAPVSYQVGHRFLDPDPFNAAPSSPATVMHRDIVADGGVIYLPPADTTAPPAEMYLDGLRTTLSPGWWGWWCRGVDLFGRVSVPTPWTLATIVDDAAPPRPILIDAEYVQAAAPVAVTGRGPEAARWLAANPGTDGLVTRWRYGPEQADLVADVDRFRLAVRLPAAGSTGPGAYSDFPAGVPAGIPGTSRVLAEYGPVDVPITGQVVAVTTDPLLSVNVIGVTALPPNPLAPPTGPANSLCRLDLDADAADGAFAGGTLTAAGANATIVSSGNGADVILTVEHAAGTAIPLGHADLTAAPGQIINVEATLPPVVAPGLRPGAGILAWPDAASGQHQLLVLARNGAVLTCSAGDDAPVVGDSLSWFPDWFAHVNGSDVGLNPTETEPARAQVAVRAVRSAGYESAPSGPGTITAVDLTIPNPPTVTAIPFDPADRCAVLATAATPFYGRSRFTLGWTAEAGRKVIVWRALSDEICRLDLAEHDRAGRQHGFPDAVWPSQILTDPVRRQRVLQELAAVDTARSVSGAARRDAVQAAYDALTIDTQVLFARQEYASAAFTSLTSEPLGGNTFEDEFDGRGHAHWLYRLTSRSAAGLESAPTASTPPICAPDVVPPAVPLPLMALADPAGGALTVRWQASPDRDLDHYDIYAAREPLAAADLDSAQPAVTYKPNPHEPGAMVEADITVSQGDWCIWIRAEDVAGNRSAPSDMLRGRTLAPRPIGPVWVSATRTPPDSVDLRWSHSVEQRLACLVERRPTGDAALGWASVSGWLPRGKYDCTDRPPDFNASWEYRIRVRDQRGQTSPVIPTIELAAQP